MQTYTHEDTHSYKCASTHICMHHLRTHMQVHTCMHAHEYIHIHIPNTVAFVFFIHITNVDSYVITQELLLCLFNDNF